MVSKKDKIKQLEKRIEDLEDLMKQILAKDKNIKSTNVMKKWLVGEKNGR